MDVIYHSYTYNIVQMRLMPRIKHSREATLYVERDRQEEEEEEEEGEIEEEEEEELEVEVK